MRLRLEAGTTHLDIVWDARLEMELQRGLTPVDAVDRDAGAWGNALERQSSIREIQPRRRRPLRFTGNHYTMALHIPQIMEHMVEQLR